MPKRGRPDGSLRGPLATLTGLLRFRAAISPRADIEFGPRLFLGRRSRISSFVTIRLGDASVSIGPHTDIGVSSFISGGIEGVIIGQDCLISPHSRIGSAGYGHSAGFVSEGSLSGSGPIRIGDNVWIGAGAVILDHVVIEEGAIIAPNSVVVGTIPKNAIVQGNPAVPIFIRR